ncbi:MAG: peptidyl-prolyl cis-trans isomerase [Desulfovibrio sp.]|nr:peptidyl-prolyl cis-trans isomerase [Desulfovibrio sp.]MCA1985439.1 peptidyl-prolyl cis-trans isomerase [Desulfovibrio sp.]
MPQRLLRRALPGALAVVLACTAACSMDPMQEGVVATVNGHPITLKELESAYDLIQLGWGGQPAVTIGVLRDQYGMVLAQMLVQTFIEQELARRDLNVTQDELNKAEALVRMDYPPGEFERMLLEEYIDLAVWRRLLRANLATEKFIRKVLRPQVQLDPAEVVAYYKANQEKFVQAAQVRVVHVTGPGRTLVRDAALAYVENPQPAAIQAIFPKVFLQEITMQENRLPKIWVEDLAAAPLLTPTVVRANQAGFESLILLERIPAKALDAGLGSPIAEKILLEARLEEAFQEWLTTSLGQANIQVSAHLLAKAREKEQLEEQARTQQEHMVDGNASLSLEAIQEQGLPMGEEEWELDENATLEPDGPEESLDSPLVHSPLPADPLPADPLPAGQPPRSNGAAQDN